MSSGVSKMKIFKILWIAGGFLFTGIGCVGIALPVLPTTPFLLLAAFCFAKGSERMDRWFRSTKLYKKHLESFVTNRSMTLRTKLTILFSASAMLLVAFAILTVKAMKVGNTVPNIVGRVLILCMFPIKYTYFFTKIKTIPEEKTETVQEKRENEFNVVKLMVSLYCQKQHKTKAMKKPETMCPECTALLEYVHQRVEKCPFTETKTFCSMCRVHCYKPEMREKIRGVMRFSGPRMLQYHPVLATRHVILTIKAKKQLKKDSKSEEKK